MLSSVKIVVIFLLLSFLTQTVYSQGPCDNTRSVISNPDTINCFNSNTVPILLDGTASTGNGLSFLWRNLSSGQVISQTSTASATQSGLYALIIQDEIGCIDTSFVLVDINKPMIFINVDSSLTCYNERVIITASVVNGTNFSYSWTSLNNYLLSPDNLNSLQVNRSDFYTLIVENIVNGCSDSSTVFVRSDRNTIAGFIPSASEVSAPATIEFVNTSSNYSNAEWYIDNVFFSSLENLTHTFSEPGSYNVLLVISEGFCIDSANAVIIISAQESENYISIPNTFTPNGDGLNEVFKIDARGLENISLQIYNRWGVVVYEITAVGMHWDGRTFAGIEVPQGQYFYKVTYQFVNESSQTSTGLISLFR
jgi:gliding motility-associated-like protein